MYIDVAISCEERYGKPCWGLYYTPQYEGPREGDLFNAGEGDEIDIHRTKYALSSVNTDGDVWKVLQAVIESEGYPIYTKLYETHVHRIEEEDMF